MKCQVDAIQWGGGSSRIFPWSPKADAIRFARGGVVAEFLHGLQKPRDSGGGEYHGFFVYGAHLHF